MRISVIVPAYNESRRIGETLEALSLAATGLSITEIVVVDDASTDETASIVERIASTDGANPAIRLERHALNLGKGAALRTGAAQADGDYIAFFDADLSVPPSTIADAMPLIENGSSLVIGSRLTLDGDDMRKSQPLYRRLLGRLFMLTRRTLVGLPYRDTQCPFKLMTREVAEELLPRCEVNGWSFDVEMLVLADRLGIRAIDMPVTWRHAPYSTLRTDLRIALRTLRELIAIRRKYGRA